MKKQILPNIAFFDSGQGGLTVWENVRRRFPNLNTQYLGDNARYPYGNKSEDTIIRYAFEAALFLATRNAELLVVACGTVSNVAVKQLQHIFKIPVVGIVEGFCKYVSELQHDKTKPVAVLGTRFTIRSNRFNEELSLYGINNVWAKACPLFVPLVEEGVSEGPLATATADMYLYDIPKETEIVMLACTHYPRLIYPIANSLEKHTGKTIIYKNIDGETLLKQGSGKHKGTIYLVEPSSSIVHSVAEFLNQEERSVTLNGSDTHIFCTDSPAQFESIAQIFTTIPLPTPIAVEIRE